MAQMSMSDSELLYNYAGLDYWRKMNMKYLYALQPISFVAVYA